MLVFWLSFCSLYYLFVTGQLGIRVFYDVAANYFSSLPAAGFFGVLPHSLSTTYYHISNPAERCLTANTHLVCVFHRPHLIIWLANTSR